MSYGALPVREKSPSGAAPSRGRPASALALSACVLLGVAALSRTHAAAKAGAAAAAAAAPSSPAALDGVGATLEGGKVDATVYFDSESRMPLHAYVHISIGGADDDSGPYVASVQYVPKAKNGYKTLLNPLWTRNITLSKSGGNYEAGTHVYRIRPATDYDFHVFISEAGGDAQLRKTVKATSAGTGIPRFDEKPLATISGGTPGWEMLSMVYGEFETVGHDNQAFAGVVAVDQAGWVVWLCVFLARAAARRARARDALARRRPFFRETRAHTPLLFLPGTRATTASRAAATRARPRSGTSCRRAARARRTSCCSRSSTRRTGRRTTASTGARTRR